MRNGESAKELSTVTLSWLKPVRALFAFLLFPLLLLPRTSDWVNIVWEGQRGSPPLKILRAEPKLLGLGYLLVVERPAYKSPKTADIEDALAGRTRGIDLGARPASASSELEEVAKTGIPILIYDQARVRVFAGFDRRNDTEFLDDPAMADGDPRDHDSF